MYFCSPPILRMSCSWCMRDDHRAAPRNSSALKKACVIRWKMPPRRPTRRARRSCSRAAKRRIGDDALDVVLHDADQAHEERRDRADDSTTTAPSRDSSNSGDMRATMKMPAVTIVAAWISAEIGVGPSIESGSHTCSGNCADLPIAPMNRQSRSRSSTTSMPGKISMVSPASSRRWRTPRA